MSTPPTDIYRQHCVETLETALEKVPAYASWKRFDPGPSCPVDERYRSLPVLTKKDLRRNFPDAWLPRGRDLQEGLKSGAVEYVGTSGTTDDQVTVLWHQPWWDASERAHWKLHSLADKIATGYHKEAVLASVQCVGPKPKTPGEILPMETRVLGRWLFLNQNADPALWTPEDIARMADELERFQPVVLEGDPVYLAAFADRVAERGRAVHQPEMIFLTYAFPSRLQLRRTRKAFRCEIASSHGSTETGFVFTACEKGRFHQNLDSCRVDFLPFQARYGGPHRGKIFVTTFGNPWFPVLRFDIGDLVRLDDRGPCPCGRNRGLTLAAIEGRAQDSTLRPDGGLVTLDELDAALARVEGLRAYRLDQLDAEAYRLKAIPEPTHAELTVLSSAKKALQRLYGPAARIEVESVTALTPEPSGKFRLARALFPIDTDVFLESRPLRDVV